MQQTEMEDTVAKIESPCKLAKIVFHMNFHNDSIISDITKYSIYDDGVTKIEKHPNKESVLSFVNQAPYKCATKNIKHSNTH